MMSEILIEVFEILGIISVGVLVGYKQHIKKWVSKFTKYDEYTNNNEIACRVHGELGQILEQCKAGRVWFARFHNGEYFADGGALTKYSISYMEVHKSVGYPNSWPDHFQSIITSHASELLTPLFKNEYVHMDTGAFEQGGYFHRILTYNDVREISVRLVKYNGHPIGFLGVSWTTGRPCPVYHDNNDIFEGATRIGAILNKRGK